LLILSQCSIRLVKVSVLNISKIHEILNWTVFDKLYWLHGIAIN